MIFFETFEYGTNSFGKRSLFHKDPMTVVVLSLIHNECWYLFRKTPESGSHSSAQKIYDWCPRFWYYYRPISLLVAAWLNHLVWSLWRVQSRLLLYYAAAWFDFLFEDKRLWIIYARCQEYNKAKSRILGWIEGYCQTQLSRVYCGVLSSHSW